MLDLLNIYPSFVIVDKAKHVIFPSWLSNCLVSDAVFSLEPEVFSKTVLVVYNLRVFYHYLFTYYFFFVGHHILLLLTSSLAVHVIRGRIGSKMVSFITPS